MPVAVPYPGGPGAYAGLAYIDAHPEIGFLFRSGAINLVDVFRRALAAGALDGSNMVADFARALDQTVRASKNQLATLHHQVGSLAQQNILEAYEQARVTKGRHIAPYRESTRDANGRLAHALGREDFFRGTPDGIGLANRSMLDKEARQWHRLNFGARPASGDSPGRFPLTWDGLVVGAIGLPAEPSAPFVLPRGVWIGEGGTREQAGGSRTGQFYPQSQRAALAGRGVLGRPGGVRRAGGIRAWNFLDAGIATIATEIGPAYQNLYDRWLASSAQRGVGPLSRVVKVHQ